MATTPGWTYRNFTNLTIEVPVGTTIYKHGKELCLPITMEEIVAFFLLNFATHVATVVSSPGEATVVNVANMLLALLFPTSGLMRALNFLVRRVPWVKNDLDRACRAGALVTVIRNKHWRPPPSQAIEIVIEREEAERGTTDIELGAQSQPSEATYAVYNACWLKENLSYWIYADTLWGRTVVNESWSKIHGTYMLPRGYSFAILPHDTVIVPRVVNSTQLAGVTATVSASNSKAKVILSTIQLLYASYTVFGRRGDQFQTYGFASPYLLVIPYAIMSFVNGVAHVLTPEYASLFMVYSAEMKEAMNADGQFEGVMGQVVQVDSERLVCHKIHGNRPNRMGFGSRFDFQWSGVTESSIRDFWGPASGLTIFPSPVPALPGSSLLVSQFFGRLYLYFMQRNRMSWREAYAILHFSAKVQDLVPGEAPSIDAAIPQLPQLMLDTFPQGCSITTTDRTHIKMPDMVRPRSWEHLIVENLYYKSVGHQSGGVHSNDESSSIASSQVAFREETSATSSRHLLTDAGYDPEEAFPCQHAQNISMSAPSGSVEPLVYNIITVSKRPQDSLLGSIWSGNRAEVKKWLTSSETLTPINLLGSVMWLYFQSIKTIWSILYPASPAHTEAKPAKIYVPTCSRFLRWDDPESELFSKPVKPYIARLVSQTLRAACIVPKPANKIITIRAKPRPETQ